MSAALIIIGSILMYLSGYILTARQLFSLWRPADNVVRCVKRTPVGEHCPSSDGNHSPACYKQLRHGERVGYGWRKEAIRAAMGAAIVWPALILVVLIVIRQPELPSDREKRLKDEAKARAAELAELEKQLEASRKH